MEKSSGIPNVSVITSTLNEKGNITRFINQLNDTIKNNNIKNINELIIVDDGSTDGTLQEIEQSMNAVNKFSIKLIKRNKKMGTVDAQITGSEIAKNNYLLIIDADLQHPLRYIPDFIKNINENTDLVIGSRYVKGSDIKLPMERLIISKIAHIMAYIMIKRSRRIKDPLSGYFLVKKEYISNLKKYPNSYKLLLYVLSEYKNMKIKEIPIHFAKRGAGNSKVVDNEFKTVISYSNELYIYWKISTLNGAKI